MGIQSDPKMGILEILVSKMGILDILVSKMGILENFDKNMKFWTFLI